MELTAGFRGAFILCCLGNGFIQGSAIRSDDGSRLEVLVEQLVSQVNHLEAQVTSQQAQITSLRNQNAQQSAPLVFTGTVSGAKQYNPGEMILFNSVMVNVGGMYDSLTGVVTVPQDGVYSIFLRSDPPGGIDDALYLELMVNGVIRAEAYAEHGTTGSVSIALKLTAGDRISVSKTDLASHSGEILGGGTLLSVHRV